ncbi:hypothetical protein M413DRAFT_443429 [Hebeloma cylindrosporum]|uniref:Uncharacterized protein n=1 Tax=Hebeloma cylindrosporum TaxID=76867 RepID=A0A0C2YR26_HEBCY|nr:hypothetical protein M413DRAFT_443429 [Hebeloma cylindrosporum h7]
MNHLGSSEFTNPMYRILPEERNPSESSNIDAFPGMEGRSAHQTQLTSTRGNRIYSAGQPCLRANPVHRYPEEHKPSSNADFFPNATGLSIHHSTFNSVHGDMIVYRQPIEQPSLWNKYRWTDFDQQSLRYIHTSSTGIVTMEMEPMSESSTSRIKVYRIHYYKDREEVFYDHLAFCKSLLARRRDIPQFLGTSENTENERFIVLAAGCLPFLDTVIDVTERRQRWDISVFQMMDIFKTGSFIPKRNWCWKKFSTLPMFSANGLLFVDIILLESHGMITSASTALVLYSCTNFDTN